MAGYSEILMSRESHKRNLPVPFFSQREVRYEWQRLAIGGEEKSDGSGRYDKGDEIGTPIHLEGSICNIVSLAMLLHYYGITDDSPDEMIKKVFETTGFEEPLFNRNYDITGFVELFYFTFLIGGSYG